MKITKLEIKNYRILRDFSIDLEDELSLIIGKNNTGKTSILTVLDKFLNENSSFSYNDFNIKFKEELEALILQDEVPSEENWKQLGIELKIHIEYSEDDDLTNVSRVLMDLDPDNNVIVLGFEYVLTYTDFQKLKKDFIIFKKEQKAKVKEGEFHPSKILENFLNRELSDYFKIQKKSFAYNIETSTVNENQFIRLDKESISIQDIISFKYIAAKRDVTNREIDKTLSGQTSVLYKRQEDTEEKTQALEDFKDQLSKTDQTLSSIYKSLFEEVIDKVKEFGGVKLNDTEIEIISTLQHRNLLEGNTTVVYTHDKHQLPENFNGLGYMNLISMIFEIEILVQEFKKSKDDTPADINLLFIEEPEAHTHPQMQYIFIKNIKKLLATGVKREDGVNRPLQYLISTHSSHIVADSNFEDVKYLRKIDDNNIEAKNLSDLEKEYEDDTKQYQFLKQYLTINRAEVFFADKAILIEGDTEKILFPTFMKKVDMEHEGNENKYLPLLSQNISIVVVGAYSHIFEKFIGFLGIKTLLLTDIDSINDDNTTCPVDEGTKTGNSAITHFLGEVPWEDLKTLSIDKRIRKIDDSTLCVAYQQEEKDYHARSFEDAFIHINRDFINDKKDEFRGLQNKVKFEDSKINAYNLANNCIIKKTHFALDVLYHSNKKFNNWQIPEYIEKGLIWLRKD